MISSETLVVRTGDGARGETAKEGGGEGDRGRRGRGRRSSRAGREEQRKIGIVKTNRLHTHARDAKERPCPRDPRRSNHRGEIFCKQFADAVQSVSSDTITIFRRRGNGNSKYEADTFYSTLDVRIKKNARRCVSLSSMRWQ